MYNKPLEKVSIRRNENKDELPNKVGDNNVTNLRRSN